MFEIDKYRQQIEENCRALGVKRLDLVGSATRDDFEPERSDVDVWVEFEGRDQLFDRYFELKSRLEIQFGRPVDLIQGNAVKNPYVRDTLNRDRLNIYGT